MMVGIQNISSFGIENITDIANSTGAVEMLIKIDQIAFGGIFIFIMLWVFAIIIWFGLQGITKEPLRNAIYALLPTTFIALLYRAMVATYKGNVYSAITDFQFWIFPIILTLLITILYATKKQ